MSKESISRLLSMSAVASWVSVIFMFFFKSPDDSQAVVLFMLSLFSAILLSVTLAMISFKIKSKNNRLGYFPVAESLRQAMLVSLFVVGALTLSMYDLLNFLDFGLLLIVLIAAESFFKARFRIKRENESE